MTALVIRSMETGKVRELKPPDLSYLNFDNTHPLWARDGSFLVVNAIDKKGREGIYRIDAQSGEAAPLVIREPGQGSVSARAWSPDGRTLYISRSDMKSQEEVMLARDMQSGKEREFARRKGGWGRGRSISPDGRFLAVGAQDMSKSSTALLLIPVEGGEPRELLRASAPESLIGSFVAWAPDGKSLLFMKDKGNGAPRELWRIAADGGAPRKVGLNVDWAPSLGIPGGVSASFHPDGRQVAFVMGEPKLEIWALENFLLNAAGAR